MLSTKDGEKQSTDQKLAEDMKVTLAGKDELEKVVGGEEIKHWVGGKTTNPGVLKGHQMLLLYEIAFETF